MQLNKDLREFTELLNSHGVDFLIVGAHAVAWHGLPRATVDIDFFVRRGTENGKRIVDAIEEFGFGSLGVSAEDFVADDQILQLGQPPNRIDLITKIAGVSFEDAWASKVSGDIDGLPVNYIDVANLIRNKEMVGRLQDLADAERLRKRHPEVK